jgi:hypothetical protein
MFNLSSKLVNSLSAFAVISLIGVQSLVYPVSVSNANSGNPISSPVSNPISIPVPVPTPTPTPTPKPASITVVSPNGGEKWQIGKTYRISWNSKGADQIRLKYSDGSGNVYHIITFSDNPGYYDWTIPSTLTPGNNYKIEVVDASLKGYALDWSDNYFSISKTVPLEFDLDKNGILGPGDYNLLGKIVTQLVQCPAGKVCDINKDGKVTTTDWVALGNLIEEYKAKFDLNNNGKIDSGDYQLQGRVVAALQACPQGKICDINSDGKVTASDWTAIGNLVAEHASPVITYVEASKLTTGRHIFIYGSNFGNTNGQINMFSAGPNSNMGRLEIKYWSSSYIYGKIPDYVIGKNTYGIQLVTGDNNIAPLQYRYIPGI